MEKEETNGKVEYLIVQRIDTKLREIGMSRPELAKKVKAARGTFAANTLANWAARSTIPPADIALAIADALNCSVRWLITGNDDMQEEYSFEEKRLVSRLRTLSKKDKHEVSALVDIKFTHDNKDETDIIVAVEKKAAAG